MNFLGLQSQTMKAIPRQYYLVELERCWSTTFDKQRVVYAGTGRCRRKDATHTQVKS